MIFSANRRSFCSSKADPRVFAYRSVVISEPPKTAAAVDSRWLTVRTTDDDDHRTIKNPTTPATTERTHQRRVPSRRHKPQSFSVVLANFDRAVWCGRRRFAALVAMRQSHYRVGGDFMFWFLAGDLWCQLFADWRLSSGRVGTISGFLLADDGPCWPGVR